MTENTPSGVSPAPFHPDASTKHIWQIVKWAGEGRLTDGSVASTQVRTFLGGVRSVELERYAIECLTSKFEDSGLVLQDLINEIGSRLGFAVSHGEYRGNVSKIGFDGVWKLPNEHTIVVEVKTTDAFRISLADVVGYRDELIEKGQIKAGYSSVLIVVGRSDTGDLESQVRGSRYAWDMRLISVDALIRLLKVRESVEDPYIVHRIHSILVPKEFTKLDEIVDTVFSATEDVKQDAVYEPDQAETPLEHTKPKFVPVAFNDECADRIATKLGIDLVKRSRALFSTPDQQTRVVCIVSKPHGEQAQPNYWFAFHPHQGQLLSEVSNAFVSLGCGSADIILLVPYDVFKGWLENMNKTQLEDRFYWHVSVDEANGLFTLRRKKGIERVDLTRYRI